MLEEIFEELWPLDANLWYGPSNKTTFVVQIRNGIGRFAQREIEGVDLPRSLSLYPKDVVHICEYHMEIYMSW